MSGDKNTQNSHRKRAQPDRRTSPMQNLHRIPAAPWRKMLSSITLSTDPTLARRICPTRDVPTERTSRSWGEIRWTRHFWLLLSPDKNNASQSVPVPQGGKHKLAHPGDNLNHKHLIRPRMLFRPVGQLHPHRQTPLHLLLIGRLHRHQLFCLGPAHHDLHRRLAQLRHG